MQANIKMSNIVIKIMFWMVPIATNTHWTTCFNPLARLMARRGRNTRKTRKIFNTEISEAAYFEFNKIMNHIMAPPG